MMRLLLDTCVVSQMAAPVRPEVFDRWMRGVDFGKVAVSVVTVAEIRFGLSRLPDGKRKTILTSSIDGLFARMPALPLPEKAGEVIAECLFRAERSGRPMSFTDAAIAATALLEKRRLVTRDADFSPLGLNPFNPWEP